MLPGLRQYFSCPAFVSFVICGMLLTAAPVSADYRESVFEGTYICGHAPPPYTNPPAGCVSPNKYVVYNYPDWPREIHHYINMVTDGHCPAGSNQIGFQCAVVCDLAQTFASNSECFSRSANKNILDKDLGAPTTCPATYAGDPINFSTGNLVEVETDYQSAGDFPLSVVRTYNSNTGAWIFNHQLSISPIVAHYLAAYNIVIDVIYQASAMRADGKKLLYAMVGVTQYSSSQSGLTGATTAVDADITDKLVAGLSGSSEITGWTYARADSDVVETYYADGKLHTETNRAGIQHTYTYTGTPVAGITVAHSNGATIAYTLDNGKVTGFTAGGKVYGYNYTGDLLTSIAYPDSGGSKIYSYSAGTSYLEKVTDENNSDFTFWTYDASGKATSSQHAGGADLTTISYTNLTTPTGITHPDEDGNVTVTNALGQQTTYFFKTILGVRKIVRVTGVDNASCATSGKAYTYNTSGFLTSKTDWKNVITSYTPDTTTGQELSRTEAVGTPVVRTISTTWHADFNLPLTIAETGRLTTLTYQSSDAMLQSKTIEDTATNETQVWGYGSTAGRLESINGPIAGTSDTTNVEYYPSTASANDKYNLKKITNAKGQFVTFSDYNARGQPTKKVDANNVETVYEWYARGWLKKLTVRKVGETDTNKHAVTVFDRDNVGQLTKLTRPDGSFASFEYDNAHRLHAIMNYQNDRIEYVRDAAGNVTGETVRKNATANTDGSGTKVQGLTRGYDELSRLIWVKNDAGTTVASYTYDDNGNIDTMTRSGLVTDYDFDALNRLSTIKDPLHTTNDPHKTQYMHDALDHITKVIDANNLETKYTINGLDEITKLESPDSGITKFTTYDDAGNVLIKTHGDGTTNTATNITSTYTWDVLNRPLTITHTGGGGGTDSSKDIEYTWDADCGGDHGKVIGRLCKVTRGTGTTASIINYKYNYLGYMIEETKQPKGSSGPSITIGYGYNDAGDLISATYPGGRTVTYPNTAGRMTAINTAATGASSVALINDIAYQPFAGINHFQYPINDPDPNVVDPHYILERNSDLDGRLTDINITDSRTNSAITRTYGYDNFNNINSITMPASGDIENYEFDELQRLKKATGSYGKINYSYDAVGNRKQLIRSEYVVSTQGSAAVMTPRYTEDYLYEGQTALADNKTSNRLKNIKRTAPDTSVIRERIFEHDARGNVKEDHRITCAPSNAQKQDQTLTLSHGKANRLDGVTVSSIPCTTTSLSE